MSSPATAEIADAPQDVRDRILAAARNEFAAHGLAGASVRAIAARAGVTAAMINYYFRGKRTLYEEVVDGAMSRLRGRVQEALGAPGEEELWPVRLTVAYFDFLSEERDLQRLIMHEVLARGESIAAYARRYVLPFRSLLESRASGDDAFQTAVSLFGAVAGYFLYEPALAELLGDDPLSPDRLAARRRHIVDLATRLAVRFEDEPT